jgi:hypothetical protein
MIICVRRAVLGDSPSRAKANILLASSEVWSAVLFSPFATILSASSGKAAEASGIGHVGLEPPIDLGRRCQDDRRGVRVDGRDDR